MHDEQAVLDKLIRWGESQETVRLMLLTSTRANPDLPQDALSDYDVELAVTDMAPYLEQTGWLYDLGTPLIYIHPLDYPKDQRWDQLAATFVGPGITENWDALYRMADLFRNVAIEVGDALGYTYPTDLDERVSAYLHKMQIGSGQ